VPRKYDDDMNDSMSRRDHDKSTDRRDHDKLTGTCMFLNWFLYVIILLTTSFRCHVSMTSTT
jgi:hypothetical protein